MDMLVDRILAVNGKLQQQLHHNIIIISRMSIEVHVTSAYQMFKRMLLQVQGSGLMSTLAHATSSAIGTPFFVRSTFAKSARFSSTFSMPCFSKSFRPTYPSVKVNNLVFSNDTKAIRASPYNETSLSITFLSRMLKYTANVAVLHLRYWLC